MFRFVSFSLSFSFSFSFSCSFSLTFAFAFAFSFSFSSSRFRFRFRFHVHFRFRFCFGLYVFEAKRKETSADGVPAVPDEMQKVQAAEGPALFVRSFVPIRSFVCSFVCSLVRSFCSFRSFVSFVCSFERTNMSADGIPAVPGEM